MPRAQGVYDATPLASGRADRGIRPRSRMRRGLRRLRAGRTPRLLVGAGRGHCRRALRRSHRAWPRSHPVQGPRPWQIINEQQAAQRATATAPLPRLQPPRSYTGRKHSWRNSHGPDKHIFAAEFLERDTERRQSRLRRALPAAPAGGAAGGGTGRRRPPTTWSSRRHRHTGTKRAGAARARQRGPVPNKPLRATRSRSTPAETRARPRRDVAATEPGIGLVIARPWGAQQAARLAGHAARVGANSRSAFLLPRRPRRPRGRQGASGLLAEGFACRWGGDRRAVAESRRRGAARGRRRRRGGLPAVGGPGTLGTGDRPARRPGPCGAGGDRRRRTARAAGFTWEATARGLRAAQREAAG